MLELRQAAVGFQFNVQTGTARHVVKDDRAIGGLAYRPVVRHHAVLGGTGIIRHDHQEGICPGLLNHLDHADRMSGVVRSGTRNDRNIDCLPDHPDQIDLFVHVGHRGFPRGAVDENPIGPIGHQSAGQGSSSLEVHGSIGLHGGDHGRNDPAEGGRWHQMGFGLSHSFTLLADGDSIGPWHIPTTSRSTW